MDRLAVSASFLKCPTCRKRTEKEGNAFFPFCSERCRLADLGKWLDGAYAIPDTQTPPSPEEPDSENNY
ncbi:DNA gyrase inhibitor YacG [Nitrospina sp. 32_T5]|uniref:DNA gyrase inhibitor YacG n=1 Tax=unclassified Nitrospina TaxID=2638683 RepID=UPI003F9D70BF